MSAKLASIVTCVPATTAHNEHTIPLLLSFQQIQIGAARHVTRAKNQSVHHPQICVAQQSRLMPRAAPHRDAEVQIPQ